MKDTITSIITAYSDAGVGIIRVSGDEAINIVNSIFVPKNSKYELLKMKSHTIHYGHIVNNGEIVDEVMVSLMKAPNSYTMEDTVEINCHGGVLVIKKILDLVLKNGARLAEPGEFTKRAFLNGRIDLAKAEAVMDLIHSKSEFSLKSSINQLDGVLSNCIFELRNNLIHEIAYIESALDDPEHFDLSDYPILLEKKIDEFEIIINKLISSYQKGQLVKEGISTVIVGRPNVGKSSFLNALLGRERAIVTNIAGTTRDTLEESITLNGISLNLVDTAGIHDTEDEIEKIGVNKAYDYIDKADLVLFILDGSDEFTKEDSNILNSVIDKNVIFLINKSDLNTNITDKELKEIISNTIINNNLNKDNNFKKINNINIDSNDNNINYGFNEDINIDNIDKYNILNISAKNRDGIDELEKIITDMFFDGKINFDHDELLITNIRHKECLDNSLQSLIEVKKSISLSLPEDFYSIDLMNAYKELGKIVGEEVEDDLVNEIFSKFCMGK